MHSTVCSRAGSELNFSSVGDSNSSAHVTRRMPHPVAPGTDHSSTTESDDWVVSPVQTSCCTYAFWSGSHYSVNPPLNPMRPSLIIYLCQSVAACNHYPSNLRQQQHRGVDMFVHSAQNTQHKVSHQLQGIVALWGRLNYSKQSLINCWHG